MNYKSKKARLAAVLGVLLAIAAVTGAVAYFTGASGSANGSGTVGSSAAWSVSMGTPTWQGSFTALYPGATNNNEYLPFTITNNGKGYQSIQSITAVMMTNHTGSGSATDAATSSGADIAGCTASWFTPTLDAGNPAVPDDLAPGASYSGKVDLTMQDSGTNQNNCQGAAPGVTVSAS